MFVSGSTHARPQHLSLKEGDVNVNYVREGAGLVHARL